MYPASLMKTAEIEKLSFEDALHQVEALVSKLEAGELKLDETVDAVATGQDLLKHCRAQLAQAEVKLQKLNPETGDVESES